MMSENNVYYVLPIFTLFLYQKLVVWRKLPSYNKSETLVNHHYSDKQIFFFVLIYYLILCLFVYQSVFTLLPLLSQNNRLVITIVGYILFLSGFFVSVVALKQLGPAWTAMAFYRIKANQKLITKGIYKYIRHPIYLSIILQAVGYELIVNSWLFLIFAIVLFLTISFHINKEEKMLTEYWKDKYVKYSLKTKRLVPMIY